MIQTAFLAALLAAGTPGAAAAPAPQISAEGQAALRCSAAFALVSYGQAHGEESMLQWPDLDPRGREFFVRTMAQLIDETGLDRDQVAELASKEAQRLLDQNEVDKVMPSCLAMLDASGI
ncbi:hypothetical protein [Altererythrobacter sp.]|uniref:hypothetical protein n=1 Tax=Altererythrobacter sp. TaxID=1872480 RepID=UPI003D06396E